MGGDGGGRWRWRVAEAEGGAVSSLYPRCIPPKRGVCGGKEGEVRRKDEEEA